MEDFTKQSPVAKMRDRESHSAAHWDETSIRAGAKLLRNLVEKHDTASSIFWEDNAEAEEWVQNQ